MYPEGGPNLWNRWAQIMATVHLPAEAEGVCFCVREQKLKAQTHKTVSPTGRPCMGWPSKLSKPSSEKSFDRA